MLQESCCTVLLLLAHEPSSRATILADAPEAETGVVQTLPGVVKTLTHVVKILTCVVKTLPGEVKTLTHVVKILTHVVKTLNSKANKTLQESCCTVLLLLAHEPSSRATILADAPGAEAALQQVCQAPSLAPYTLHPT